MASVHIPRHVDIDFMFNISTGVGRGRANNRLDVMLIQYLLNQATDETVAAPITTKKFIRPPELSDPLKQDGICGEKTQRFIDFYQQFRNSHEDFSDANRMAFKFTVKADGAIDPWQFPIPMNVYYGVLTRSDTLVALNYDAAKSQEVSTQVFSTMHPDLQRILCAR